VEQYRTEAEQVEALRRWWKENGRSTIAGVVIALAVGFGWQTWQGSQLQQQERASDMYQNLLRVMSTEEASSEAPAAVELAEQIKSEFGSSSYAQFAALQLAAMAVADGKLPDAEAQLRWVLGKADSGSDIARLAQLRLARVLAASGNTEQALGILQSEDPGPYSASYAIARGDILLAAGRNDEAREVYTQALAGDEGGALNLPSLQQKLQSLSPVPPRAQDTTATTAPESGDAAPATNNIVDAPEK
jgi:predicted negative regulator of RcsB-dependent stress response